METFFILSVLTIMASLFGILFAVTGCVIALIPVAIAAIGAAMVVSVFCSFDRS